LCFDFLTLFFSEAEKLKSWVSEMVKSLAIVVALASTSLAAPFYSNESSWVGWKNVKQLFVLYGMPKPVKLFFFYYIDNYTPAAIPTPKPAST
jgi:hypothetical protein